MQGASRTHRRCVGAIEVDAFTGWRRFLTWHPGERQQIKRRANRRERRAERREDPMRDFDDDRLSTDDDRRLDLGYRPLYLELDRPPVDDPEPPKGPDAFSPAASPFLYRSKPTEVEAVQWTGDGASLVACQQFARHAVEAWLNFTGDADGEPSGIRLLAGVNGAQGWVPVPVGHWIVRNPGDETHYWPVDPEFFARKYEPAASR